MWTHHKLRNNLKVSTIMPSLMNDKRGEEVTKILRLIRVLFLKRDSLLESREAGLIHVRHFSIMILLQDKD